MGPYCLEANFLLDIINCRQPAQSDKINFEKLIGIATSHELIALIFYRLQEYHQQLPQADYSFLKSRYLGNISRNLKLWNEFLQISSAFEKNNIAMLPIKGIDMLARFYPAFDLRSMVDIDVLIREEQCAEAEKVLSALGYQKKLFGLKEEYWRKQQCHITFHKNRIVVEVHWGLDFRRGGRVILPGFWERIQKKEAGDYKVSLLSPEDAIFSFALHLRRYGNILSLKQVFDTARIIKESSGFDWEYVLKECQNSRAKATLYFILTQVNLFTDTRIPVEIFRRLKLPKWQKMLIKRLILRRTFQMPVAIKKNYLAAHFLLYDSLYEPIDYLINIPYEQFCRFYKLKPYARSSDLLYRLRLLYMPIYLSKNLR